MESNRRMYTITDPFPTVMAIPDGFNSPYRGQIPRSIILYTRGGTLLARLHAETDVEGTTFKIVDETIGYLLAHLSIEPGEFLEFERHSNTDIVVRAYDRRGHEKNIGRSRNTHCKVHYRVEFDYASRSILDISTADLNAPFTSSNPNQIGLMTKLGHQWVTGAAKPAVGDGCYRLYGPTWESFRRRHGLIQGMIMVLEHAGYGFNFNVLVYNADGSEATTISRKPDGFNPEEMSFYRYPHDINFEGPQLRLGTRFVMRNWNLLTSGLRIVTAAGIFNMQYDRNSENDYVITGDWKTIFQYFAAENNTMFKFSISLNNKRNFVSGRGTIFVVSFKDAVEGNSHAVRETSIEVTRDSNCTSDEDSVSTHHLH